MKFLALALLPSLAFAAQENFGAGSQAAPWLKLPNSARTAALGEAAAALGDDVNSVSVNPAGLTGLGGQQLSLLHNVYVQDSAVEHVAYGMSLGEGSGFAVSLDYLNFGTVDKYKLDASNNLVADGTFNPTGMDLNAAYAKAMGGVSLGLNAKMVSQTLDGAGSSAFGADLGALWRQSDGGLSLGLAVQNIGLGQLDGANLPLNIKAGLAYRLSVADGKDGLLFAADTNSPTADFGASAFSLGAEYSGGRLYALRGGYKLAGNGGAGGFSAGAGLTYNIATLDYAFVSQGVLGNSNQVSLTVKF